MSHAATNWAIQQRGLKPATKIVLWHLCDRHNPDFGCFPTQARLAEDYERYYLVARQEHFRIGIVIIAAPDSPVTFRMEVLLQVLAKNTRPQIAYLECVNDVLGILSSRGYSLEHHDNCNEGSFALLHFHKESLSLFCLFFLKLMQMFLKFLVFF